MHHPVRVALLALCILLVGIIAVQAAELYVAKERGDNQNAGTKDAPFKNLEAALKVAKPGDKIFVAQGNYVGLRDKGYLEAPQPVELMGGYSLRFLRPGYRKIRDHGGAEQ